MSESNFREFIIDSSSLLSIQANIIIFEAIEINTIFSQNKINSILNLQAENIYIRRCDFINLICNYCIEGNLCL